MQNLLAKHIEHNYYTSFMDIADGIYFLIFPENILLGIPKREIELKIDNDALLFSIRSPVEKTINIKLDKYAQTAFLSLYISVEQTRRMMSPDLIAVYNKANEYIGANIYEVVELSELEKTYNAQLLSTIIFGEKPNEQETGALFNNHYNLVLRYLEETTNA